MTCLIIMDPLIFITLINYRILKLIQGTFFKYIAPRSDAVIRLEFYFMKFVVRNVERISLQSEKLSNDFRDEKMSYK